MFSDMDGIDRGTIENRAKWDPGVIKVLELIE